MNTKKYQLENYRKYLLNRMTATQHLVDYIENSLASEDESAHHSFHKIMIHNWTVGEAVLFETLGEYFSPSFVPVNYTSQGAITTFYTSSLTLILKMIKLDFMFPHQRTMFNVDILFNDKSSADCFENRITIEDIVAGVVSSRFNDKCELDLSDFCNDSEFIQKKIHFYKINLLSHFKILMLRMGRDTKILNLSKNNLSHVPVDILNFFIKGDLVAINLSYNNIPSLQELHRVSSKIEKLWVEGNPLCEDIDPMSYVKKITVKFPRLNELDGIKLNEHGVVPFIRNYLVTPDKRTKMLVDKFLSIYFSRYDYKRIKIEMFYALKTNLTIQANWPETTDKNLEIYLTHSRNILDPKRKTFVVFNHKSYKTRDAVRGALCHLPTSEHDPTTFTIDVLRHDKRGLLLVVEGVFREKEQPNNVFQFRRTFLFSESIKSQKLEFFISNEMFTLSLASKEMKQHSFKNPLNINIRALHNPDVDDINALCNIFSHISKLKKSEAELQLKKYGYDINEALKQFTKDLKLNKIPAENFVDDDDFSDTSSLIEDELDMRLKRHDNDIQESLTQFPKKIKLNNIPAENFVDEDDFSDTSSLIDDE